MAFRSIQQVLDYLAGRLQEACRAAAPESLGGWRFRGELSYQLEPPEDAAAEVPLVVLQAGSQVRGIAESQHACFSYTCELVVFCQPEGPAPVAVLQQLLAQLEVVFSRLLAEVSDSALVDPADDVAGVYLVQALVDRSTTETTEVYFLMKLPFKLVLQF